MSNPKTKILKTSQKKSSPNTNAQWQFILYIADQTPHCLLTLANLKKFCERYLHNQYRIDVIDLRQHPELAHQEEIIAIPTVVKTHPHPKRYIIGDFADSKLMLMKLGINQPDNINDKTK
ncbi:circadian clock KaiB family protein [Legionella worsleiensis]|uniref:KaiB-like protein 2 n=1 Tax=Legionella worsleiensis TaxID=45076 RepID=A0A0W1AAC0_9GAMM|nr:circadian clock KaiB family protein [Legionella worsleiensis]KTD78290.1 KaiB-like protein 2 [Legionella worsleiensis]STY32627.1 KaiB-like protein 2 [Legionella worsleiensis]